VVAENRAARPNEFAPAERWNPSDESASSAAAASSTCPFCPGHESQTPASVYERRDDEGRWRLRVVPNKFPALTLSETSAVATSGVDAERSSALPAFGAHEVVIESPRHIAGVSEMTVSEFAEVLEAYAQRLAHWRDAGRFRYGLVFKNVGPQGGATLSHVHSQLVAMADPPPAVARELRRAEDDFNSRGTCPYCRLVAEERKAGERIVWDADGFVAFCPYASLQPYEVWLLPADHEARFEDRRGSAGLESLAKVLHALISRVETVVPFAAGYNLLVRTAPWVEAVADWCHWRIEIIPRVTAMAGLELATGLHVNPLPPELAARHWRQDWLFAGA
jgi:UDPglucose--hexose-1-phosphate uridylyltransferase